jgi:Ca2+/Na+ antiporter
VLTYHFNNCFQFYKECLQYLGSTILNVYIVLGIMDIIIILILPIHAYVKAFHFLVSFSISLLFYNFHSEVHTTFCRFSPNQKKERVEQSEYN